MPSAITLERPKRTSPDTACNSSGRDAKGVWALTHSDDTTRELRAIETRYNGYRFRSRLEARWAVFFDSLVIEYRYETEGFRLPSGTLYLCDFEVPEWAAWIEIKPESTDVSAAQAKLRQLSDATGRAALLVAGSPWPDEYRVDFWHPNASKWQERCIFFGCFGCTSLWIANEDGVRHLGARNPLGARTNKACLPLSREGWELGVRRGEREGLTDRLELAFHRARGARFEHGESGG
jgi:hypothetical protein